jgi:putative DNA primase/helicase
MTFLESKSEKIRNDIARLHSCRIVFASESSVDKYLDEGAIKQMTGGDKITARYLFKEYFEYTPQFKIWLITNQFPQIKQNDHALWRRIIPIKVEYKVPKNRRDNHLQKKLLIEKQGILKWLIEGAIEWYDIGLNPPKCILDSKAELRYEADIIKLFIDERCEIIPDGKCQVSRLYQSFKAWAEENGYSPYSIQVFTKKLKDLGLIAKRNSKKRFWQGIKLV